MQEETPTIDVNTLQLDDVVGMEPADLSDTHREYLESNKQNLTADQQVKFGFTDVTPDPKADPAEKKVETDEYDPNKVEPVVKSAIKMDDLGEDDEDDDMDAEDRARIRKQVAKGSKSIVDRQQEYEDRTALNNIVSERPELKKYQDLAYKYMKAHPSLVADDAMKIASAGDQQKIGASREREASERAKATANPGTSYRSSSGGAKDWSKATTEEVEAQIAFAKGQR